MSKSAEEFLNGEYTNVKKFPWLPNEADNNNKET